LVTREDYDVTLDDEDRKNLQLGLFDDQWEYIESL
jgi:hypothetical protein